MQLNWHFSSVEFCHFLHISKWKSTVEKITWTNWYLWSRCSPSWQSRQVNFTQVSQYSFSNSFGWVGHIMERRFDEAAVNELADAPAALADSWPTGSTLWSFVTLTRRCAWAHGSHSHSPQSVQKWLAAIFSSQPVQLWAVSPSLSLAGTAAAADTSGTNMLSIMFDIILTWRQTQQVICPSDNKPQHAYAYACPSRAGRFLPTVVQAVV